jgi:glycosyltransferase involved in cell wall biosynthesis
VAKKYDWKRMLYGKVVARRLARRQDQIIAISQNTARDIRECFRLPAEKIAVIYNGIEHDRFFPGSREEAAIRVGQRHRLSGPPLTRPSALGGRVSEGRVSGQARAGSDELPNFFLYIARLEHPAKNHVRLVSAFNQFKSVTKSNWQLVFGGSDWHGAEAIHSAIEQSPFAADIRCLGFVSDEDLPDLYRAADAFVYPSLYEGFGLPPVEAMACGSPVIASTRGPLGEVIGDAAAIVDPEDVAGMAKQLQALANDASLRERLRDAGLEQARKFDWQKTAAETLGIYEQAANPKSAAVIAG